MNIKTLLVLSTLATFVLPEAAWAYYYGAELCDQPGYTCTRAQYGETWESMFPDPQTRDTVKRVNRVNIRLRPGMIVAIPNDVNYRSAMDYSPFNAQIPASGSKVVLVSPKELAWAAYGEDGHLVKWGPASLGKDFCPDIGRGCRTAIGTFSVQTKEGANATSSLYPKPTGGAPMPYSMKFYKSYALHGSPFVAGRNDSHGCVRMFIEDARWLNQDFVQTGTKVVIMPYGA